MFDYLLFSIFADVGPDLRQGPIYVYIYVYIYIYNVYIYIYIYIYIYMYIYIHIYIYHTCLAVLVVRLGEEVDDVRRHRQGRRRPEMCARVCVCVCVD